MAAYQLVDSEWSNPDPANNSTEQQNTIEALPGGGYVIAWVDGNGGDNNIRVQVFDGAGTPVGSEMLANGANAPFPAYQSKFNPNVAVLADGNFVVAWDQSFGGTNGDGIFARVFTQSGSPVGAPFLAATYGVAGGGGITGSDYPEIVAAGAGEFWVISESPVPYGNYGLFAQKIGSDGVILTDRKTLVYSDTTAVISGSQVETLNNGNIAISYREYKAIYDPVAGTYQYTDRVVVRLFDSSLDPLSGFVEVSPLNDNGGVLPLSVARLPDGGFAVSWNDLDSVSNTYSVKIRIFDAEAAPVGEPQILLQDAYNLNGGLTALTDGNILASFSTSQNGNIEGQIIAPNGALVGQTFPIASRPHQTDVEVAGLADGGFASTYLGMGPGPSDWSVKSSVFGLVSQPGTTGDDVIVERQDQAGAINGLAGNDFLSGNNGANSLFGGIGADTLQGGQGNDALDGGADFDVAVYSGVYAGYTITSEGPNRFRITDIDPTNGDDGSDTLVDVESARFADRSSVLPQTYSGTILGDRFSAPNSGPWIINGVAGNDTLTGGAADDIISGGQGNDVLSGLGGDDFFLVGPLEGTDHYDGGSGIDRIRATANGVVIGIASVTGVEFIESAGFANVSIAGTSGADTMDFSSITLVGITAVDGGGGNDTIIGSAAGDVLRGGAGNDYITGGGSDSLFGDAGNDTLVSGGDADWLQGGLGNDVYVIDRAAVTVSEASGQGTDTVRASIDYSLPDNVENLVLTGSANLNGAGNAGANVLTGNAADNVLRAGAGNDTLNGGEGDDTLIGGTGADKLTGGVGADRFVIDSLVAADRDTILDFVAGQDKIALDASVFTAIPGSGIVLPTQFVLGAKATTSAQRLIYSTPAGATVGTLYYDADGSGAAFKQIAIATLAGKPSLSAVDIDVSVLPPGAGVVDPLNMFVQSMAGFGGDGEAVAAGGVILAEERRFGEITPIVARS